MISLLFFVNFVPFVVEKLVISLTTFEILF